PEPSVPVDMDIKPQSCPNPVNTKSNGVLPVAILGSEELDVTMIDVASIRLADVAPIRSSVEDVTTPVTDGEWCECTEDGPDGYLDLSLKFKTQEIVDALGEVVNGEVLLLTLEGVLLEEHSGTPIQGEDCIEILGKHKPPNKADINKDGVVDFADFAILSDNWLVHTGGSGAGIIALAEDGTGILIQGNHDLEVEPDGVIYMGAAGIQINSDDPDDALHISGNLKGIDVDEINFDVGGGAYDKHHDLEGIPLTDTGDIPDPLKFLQSYKPNPADYPGHAPDGNTIKITDGIHEFSPGYYAGGFSISGGSTTLKPGVYILGGGADGKGGLNIRGKANFWAKGVMFFITENGNVEINGNGIIEAHAIDYWDPYSTVFSDPPPGFPQVPYEYPTQFDTEHYKGILFFQDNLDQETAVIKVTSLMDLKGSLYFPENTVYLSGTSNNFGTHFIAHRFEIEGKSVLGIAYDGRFRDAAP
ncbi:MAG: hypothetical protein ACYST2_04800, partial [Planctomycetota bacterium]